MKSRGYFVVVVGPDGVGKSTVAERLAERVAPAVGYFHFRPTPFSSLHPGVPESPPQPKDLTTPNKAMGWIRIVMAVGRFWIGYLTAIRPALRAGKLVVGDRWAYGYIVQPLPLRFAGPEWLARVAIALMPRPDLIVNLAAPAEIVHSRKPELSVVEICRELEAWSRLSGNVLTLDATVAPDRIVEQILESVEA